MDAREQRGLVIAATAKLVQKGKVWLVPSQSGKGKYTVCPDDEQPFCSCPDFEDRGEPCKHLHAVTFAIQREQGSNGAVTETRTITLTQKKTYTQNWGAYNLAQTTEKRRVQELLRDLCRGLEEPPQCKTGRRRLPIADMVFGACFKVYCGMSARRTACDLEDAHEKGYLSKKINPLMACHFLENELLTPALLQLIAESAAPLKVVDVDFAVDSTGFSTSRFVRWFDEKYGCERSGHDWVKAHICTGVKTNVITAVKILDRDAGDSPQLPALVKATAERFTVREVSADKAYASNQNFEAIADVGGTGYIAFKENTTGAVGGLFAKMFHYYAANREEYMQHYHKRSNVESTASMVKAKFGDSVKSRVDTAMKNEVLAKILLHNLCCLIMSQCELGIAPVFWADEEASEPPAVTTMVSESESPPTAAVTPVPVVTDQLVRMGMVCGA
jgi:transposase/predicted nucleic acid-binding Zn finger protein